jgi:tagatose 1,6-diphosphate aldolase
MKGSLFRFLNPGRLVDGDLHLKLVAKRVANRGRKRSPCYEFEMRNTRTSRKMGRISLRIGSSRALRYPGHIGFNVREKYRGHRYAARSCRLLIPLAYAHGLKTLWITADPKNGASRRSCELAGARYMATVRIPKDHEMYREGGRYLCRYRINLAK